MLHRNIKYPYTHQIGHLVRLLKEKGLPWPAELNNADDLSDFAVHTRYPSGFEQVTRRDYDEALCLAEAVVDWAERLLGEEP